jgi:hypothetical protein
VYRESDASGLFLRDLVLPAEAKPPQGFFQPLLLPVMRGGRVVSPLPELVEVRRYVHEQLSRLPEGVKNLENPEAFPVVFGFGEKPQATNPEAGGLRR